MVRADLAQPRFSILQLAIGAILAAVVILLAISASTVWTTTPGCTSGQFAAGSDLAAKAKIAVPLPPVADGLVQAWLNAIAERASAVDEENKKLRAEFVARGEDPPKEQKLSFAQILAIVTGIGSGAAGVVTAVAARAKAATDTTDVASAVARLLATPSEKRTPEMIASLLTSALPGAKEVAAADVKAAA